MYSKMLIYTALLPKPLVLNCFVCVVLLELSQSRTVLIGLFLSHEVDSYKVKYANNHSVE